MIDSSSAPRTRAGIPTTAAALSLLATTVVAAPADVFQSPGALGEGKAPDALELSVGDGSVATQTGAYTFSLPIEVPPGRLEAAPALALRYSSQAPIYGTLAAGWTLGLPVIERDFSEGATAGIRWTSSLAGRELIPVDEPAPSGWQSYRAQSDASLARYQHDPANDTWRVLQHDGKTLYFGEPFYQDGASYAGYARLTREVDAFGNEVRYHYEHVSEAAGNELRPSMIEYSVNDGAGLGVHARVLFHYGPPVLCNVGDAPVGSQLRPPTGVTPLLSGAAPLNEIETQVASASGFRTVRSWDSSFRCGDW